jgi:hypothetical protein
VTNLWTKDSSMHTAYLHAVAQNPEEAVGMFVSLRPSSSGRHTAFAPLTNVSLGDKRHSFSVSAVEMIEKFTYLVESYSGILPPIVDGVICPDHKLGHASMKLLFHSHPTGPLDPSKDDYENLKNAAWLGIHLAWIIAPSVPAVPGALWLSGGICRYDTKGPIAKLEGDF